MDPWPDNAPVYSTLLYKSFDCLQFTECFPEKRVAFELPGAVGHVLGAKSIEPLKEEFRLNFIQTMYKQP
jgi:hypothetical protein